MPLSLAKVNATEYAQATYGRVTFMQTPGWAELRAQSGYIADFYLVNEDDRVVGAFMALVKTRSIAGIKVTASYVPRPLFFFDETRLQGVDTVLKALKKHYLLTVVEYNFPHWAHHRPDDQTWRKEIAAAGQKAGYTSSNAHIQPDATIVKTVPEGDVYASLANKYARRDARRGEKKAAELGIIYSRSETLTDERLIRVEELMWHVANKRGFNTRKAPYLGAFQRFVPGAHWFTAEHNGQLISATLCVRDAASNTDYSLYLGYHNPFDQEVYLTYTGRVKILETLQAEQCGYYDQWGISENPNSPLFKLSETKKRFGGDIIYYPRRLVASRLPLAGRIIGRFSR